MTAELKRSAVLVLDREWKPSTRKSSNRKVGASKHQEKNNKSSAAGKMEIQHQAGRLDRDLTDKPGRAVMVMQSANAKATQEEPKKAAEEKQVKKKVDGKKGGGKTRPFLNGDPDIRRYFANPENGEAGGSKSTSKRSIEEGEFEGRAIKRR